MIKKFLFILGILFFSTVAFAAPSSVSWSHNGNPSGDVVEIIASITFHSSAATFATTPLYLSEADETAGKPFDANGWILLNIATYFGTTAPTAETDMTLLEHTSSGKDILVGTGDNIIDAVTNNLIKPNVPCYGPLYLAINNNAVNSAGTTIVMKFIRYGN